MADISGVGGRVSFAASGTSQVNLLCYEWSASIDADEITIPAAFDTFYEGHVPGTGALSGSLRAKGYSDTDFPPWPFLGADDPGHFTKFTASVTLQATTSCYLRGTFLFTDIELRRPHNNFMDITANFVSTGGWTTGWA